VKEELTWSTGGDEDDGRALAGRRYLLSALSLPCLFLILSVSVLLFFLVLLGPPFALPLWSFLSLSLWCWRWFRQWSHFPLVFHQFFLFCVCVLGTEAKLGTLAFCSFLFLVWAFGPPSLGTPGLFPSVLPSVLFSGLSLSTPYLFPCLFFFVPVFWEETRKTVFSVLLLSIPMVCSLLFFPLFCSMVSLYLLPIYSLVYFSSSLFSEKKQGKQFSILVPPSSFSAIRGFFVPPRFCSSFPPVIPLLFCGLSFSGFYSQRTMSFHPLIAGVMMVASGWTVEEDERCRHRFCV